MSVPPMWRPHTFEHACFEMEFGGPRLKYFDLDMCLTLRRLVSMLVPLMLGLNMFDFYSNPKGNSVGL